MLHTIIWRYDVGGVGGVFPFTKHEMNKSTRRNKLRKWPAASLLLFCLPPPPAFFKCLSSYFLLNSSLSSSHDRLRITCPRAWGLFLFSQPEIFFFFFFGEDGSSFSSLIMPNSGPICHVYSAGTKQRGEPRLCPLPPLAPPHRPPQPLPPHPRTCDKWNSRFVKRSILTHTHAHTRTHTLIVPTLTSNITSGMIQSDSRQFSVLLL